MTFCVSIGWTGREVLCAHEVLFVREGGWTIKCYVSGKVGGPLSIVCQSTLLYFETIINELIPSSSIYKNNCEM